MKTPIRLLLASAAIFVTTIAGQCLAASQVIIPLSNVLIKSGSSILVSATTALDKSPVYFYSITGTCEGTGGAFAQFLPESTLEQAFFLIDPDLLPYLNGTVLDISQKFPFTCVNKLAKGTFLFGDTTVTGSVRVKAGINNKGIAYGEFTNVSFGVKTRFGTLRDKTDSITITDGQVVVQTVPITSGTQPDLSFETPTGLVGADITGTDTLDAQTVAVDIKKKKTASFVVVLRNSGVGADNYTLSATPADSGFTQEFIYKGKNITPMVTGTTGGFTLPPAKKAVAQTVASNGIATLTWRITNKTAATNNMTAPVLTVTSDADPTKQDAIEFEATGL